MVSRERVSERSNGAVLDEVSKAIIEQLQQDGRRPYSAIGKAVGLSEAAVRQRVQRLLETGVMQIVAVTDPLSVGFPRAAMIGVRVEGAQRELLGGARAHELEEVVEHLGHEVPGRSRVEAEAAVLDHPGATAHARVLLEDQHLVPLASEQAGGREASDACADDDDAAHRASSVAVRRAAPAVRASLRLSDGARVIHSPSGSAPMISELA